MFKLNSKKLILILLGLVVLGGVGVGGYRYYQATQKQPPTEEVPGEPAAESGWKVYKNEQYAFSAEVPAVWIQKKDGVFYKENAGVLLFIPYPEGTPLGVVDFLKRTEEEYPKRFEYVVGGLPREPNALLSGRSAVLLYNSKSPMAPASFETFVVNEGRVFKVVCVSPELGDSAEVYRHVLETFRFGDEGAETELPEFPELD